MSIARRAGLGLLLSLPLLPGTARSGQAQGAGDPAAAQVERLHEAVLGIMKNAQALGIEGRYRQIAPGVEAAFDLPAMSAYAVGSRWSSFSPAEQAQVVEAFTRMTVASYAHNFNGFSGQSFVTDRVEPRGDERIVATRLLNPGKDSVDLTYRMHQAGGTWRIIDVLHDSISELGIRRSEFVASVRQGAPTLVQRLNELSDRLMQPG